ncbi:hypothetical protein LPJ63_000951 [Coemansia sp. RSA 2711]|nr:hypothetical protein LPJ63_000951 [Coemansia sp. RSA 2711]KAJ2360399.1 hypothetical protein H4S01_005748 [Coemansia sp. RSA 2610]
MPDPPAFPVAVELAAACIDGTHTDVAVLGFSNCVVVLATQLASVACLVHAVTSRLADAADHAADPQRLADCLAADAPVDLRFLLGNPAASAASSLYQILATTVAQRKLHASPADARPVILGIGLRLPRSYNLPAADGHDSAADLPALSPTITALAELVDKCRVW